VSTYIKFPEIWMRTLLARPSTAADWKVAGYLLMQARFSLLVKLTNAKMAQLGLSRHIKWRSINKLAQWGLVLEKCRIGKSPIIRVLHLSGRQPSDG
jgi:hypothetical protein